MGDMWKGLYDQVVEQNETAAEALIDSTGLEDAVSIMADICHEKAEHILSNWQDEILAKRWSCAAKFLEQAAQKIKLLAL